MPWRSAAPVVATRKPPAGEGAEHGRALPADGGVRGDAGRACRPRRCRRRRRRCRGRAPRSGRSRGSSLRLPRHVEPGAARAAGRTCRARGRPSRRRRPRRPRRRTCARTRASSPARRRPASRRARRAPAGCATPRQRPCRAEAAVAGAPASGSATGNSPPGIRPRRPRRISSPSPSGLVLRARDSRVPSRCRPISTSRATADHHRDDEDVGDVVDRRHHPRRVDEVDDVPDREAGLAEQRDR